MRHTPPCRLARLAPAVLLLLPACHGASRPDAPTGASGPGGAATLERRSVAGPVTATVALEPREPRLGDPLVLTLTVEAEAGVRAELPAFGEALGRFTIVHFTPRSVTRPDGTSVQTQRYTLEAPMSGRQRIPPLRIEFVDERPGAASAGDHEAHELLTEELSVQVQSVLPEGTVASELRPPRPRLPLQRTGRTLAVILATAGLTALVLGLRAWRRHAIRRARITAYDKAVARLARLAKRGLPGPEQADAWYVELSAVVRRYLEDRYGVRAPELTTEEFLLRARTAAELSAAHRELLGSFLERCDRVKFAAYTPSAAESQQVLDAARRFLEETRLRADHHSPRDLASRRVA